MQRNARQSAANWTDPVRVFTAELPDSVLAIAVRSGKFPDGAVIADSRLSGSRGAKAIEMALTAMGRAAFGACLSSELPH